MRRTSLGPQRSPARSRSAEAEPARSVGPWDAIVLDVDNGPDFLIHGANADALRRVRPAGRVRAAHARAAPWRSGARAGRRRCSTSCAGSTPSAREHLFDGDARRAAFAYAIYTAERPPSPDRLCAMTTAEGDFRIERDTMGEVKVPAQALWKAQTQRAVENFPISGVPIDPALIAALGLIKGAAAQTNARLGVLDRGARRRRSTRPPRPWPRNDHDAEFPIDVFQTGSGTSSNMNTNEVIGVAGQRAARRDGAPERPCERLAVEQRRVPERDPHRRDPELDQHPDPGAAAPRGSACGQGDRVRRGGEERSDPPDGRDPGDPGPGVRRLRGPDPLRHRAGRGRPSPGSPSCRSAARRSAPGSTPRPASPRR